MRPSPKPHFGPLIARSRAEAHPRPISVIGELSVDIVVELQSPFALRDASVGKFTTNLGGSSAIVAHNAAVLGGDVTFCGRVGLEPADQAALADLSAAGVRIGATTQTPSGLRVICLVERGGERTMVASGGAPGFWNGFEMTFERDSLVFFEGWPLFDSPGLYCPYSQLIRNAAEAGATVFLDVASATRARSGTAHADLLRSLPIDYLLANETEADRFDLLRAPVSPVQIIHRGAVSTLVMHGRLVTEFAVYPVVARDTTGCGDSFAAGLLVALSTGANLAQAIDLAHKTARQVALITGPLLRVARQEVLESEVAR